MTNNETQLDTFFTVRAVFNGGYVELGPYVELGVAAEMFWDYLLDFVLAERPEVTEYHAQLTEWCFVNGNKEMVYVKSEEYRKI